MPKKNNMENTKGPFKSLPLGEENLLSQASRFYFNRLKAQTDATRVGRLLLKDKVISQSEFRNALNKQRKECRLLGKMLTQMGLLKQEELAEVLNLQTSLRAKIVSKFGEEKLKLGSILLHTKTITQEQLNKALLIQKETKELLGEILIKIGAVLRSTLVQRKI